MKKVLLWLGVAVLLVFVLLISVPFLFKDQIRAKISKEIDGSVNAKVYFDADNFSVSLFRNFPNMTVSLSNFGVIGKDDFAGDTLVSINEFSVVLDLLSVIKGDKITINSILLDTPSINALVLANGKSNWDIAKTDTSQQVAQPSEPTEFSIKINKWIIKDGKIQYYNAQSKMLALIKGLNHDGSGDFSQDVFDLDLNTTIKSFTFSLDSMQYMADKEVSAKMTLGINMPKSEYSFKDNAFKINDFGFGIDGVVSMPDTNIAMDISYKIQDASFKSLLSIVPGFYTKDFSDVKCNGKLSFDGNAKGIFNAKSLPAFTCNLKVEDGMFQYPALPSAVTGINLDLAVKSPTNSIDALELILKNLSMKIGSNPVQAKMTAKGLKSYTDVDGTINAKLDLAEISKAFPIQGLSLKGLFSINAKAIGRYSKEQKLMPTATATLALLDGYVKSSSFPAPLEQINVNAFVQNASGQLADTKLDISKFAMILEGEPITATAKVVNFDDYEYDLKLKGIVDLAKMTKIFPLEGKKIAGKMNADIATKGKMSDVTAKRYDKMPTSGTVSLQDFTYSSADLAHEVKISKSTMKFSPQSAELVQCEGTAGSSDFSMTGTLQNYIAYVMGKGVLGGNVVVNSKLLDANEWISKDEESKSANGKEVPMQVVAVPTDLDVVFVANVDLVKYDNMKLESMKGKMAAKAGVLSMNNLMFNMLDGSINMSGAYDPREIAKPKYDFKLGMNQISFKKAYETFNTVQKLAPVAKQIEGNFNASMNMNGLLDAGMKPVLNTLNGAGQIKIVNGQLNNFSLLQGVGAFAKVNMPSALSLNDVQVMFTIVNGTVNFRPFDLKVGNTKANISGSQGFAGDIDYLLKLTIPAGVAGTMANEALAKLTGKANTAGGDINLGVKVGGTMTAPKYSIVSAGGNSAKTEAKAVITNTVNDAKEKAKAELEKAKVEAEQRAKAEVDRLKNETKQRAEEELKKLKNRFKF